MKWVNDLIGRVLLPPIITKLDELRPALLKLVADKFDEWLPKIAEVVVVAVARSAGQLTVSTADKVTDIIPGTLDDRIVDPIVRDVMNQVGPIFGGLFGKR